jgi:acetolactate synthase-1/2/3 large subunit
MKASDLFVRQLEEEGVRTIFGLPGEENLDFLDSIRKSSITFVLTRHEQAAAFMAATCGRLTGRAGVCFSTLGPGATNLVTGVAHAQLIGAPMVSISGQKAVKENWQARFQLIDVVSLMRPVTKKSVSIVDPATIPTVLRDAFKVAETERPGAVHVELPEDVAAESTEVGIQTRTSIRRPSPDPRALEQAAAVIRKAENPVLLVSSGANRSLVARDIVAFTERTGLYVAHTQMGKGIMPDDCDRSLYTAGIHKHDYIHCGMDRADVVVTVGYNIVAYPPYVWNRDLSKKIVNIDFTPSEPDRYFNPCVEVVGDISSTLRSLADMVGPKRDFMVFRKTRETMDGIIDAPVEKRFPPLPQDVVRTVRRVMGPGDIVTLDNGIYKLWFSRLYRTFRPNTVLLDNALATMGAGLPSGIAAGMLNPDKRVLAVCGDGGFLMNSQDLETALRLDIPLVVLVLNDNAFGFVKWKQRNMGLEPFGLDYQNPDFVAYAESFGAAGFRVREGHDLGEVLERAFSLGKTALVECPIDYSVNYEVFSRELGNLVCRLGD